MLKIGFDFTWERPVNRDGYEWVDVGGSEMQLVRQNVRFAKYEPLSMRAGRKDLSLTGLFRTFANLEATPKAIRRFANRYGLPDHQNSAAWSYCTGWAQRIAQFKALVNLWDALTKLDWRAVHNALDRHWQLSTGTAGVTFIKASASENELASEAIRVLYDTVFMTLGSVMGMVGQPGASRVTWDKSEHRLLLKPPSLWWAMHVQFAHSIFGSKTYQQCSKCGRWFELMGDEGSRADRLTCSTGCRVNLYQARRREALRLNAAGQTIKQIASITGSDAKTVKGWLTKRKEK